MKRNFALVSLLLLGVSCLGCQGFPFCRKQPAPLPVVFSKQPVLSEIEAAVNQNSHRIQSMQSNNASVTVPSIVPLAMRTNLALERPKRLRMRGEISNLAGGQEFDIGSNDEQFWIWFRREPNRLFYTGRHDKLANSTAAQTIPIDPQWVVESLGIVEFKPEDKHDGPFITNDGNLEVSTVRQTPSGIYRKITTIDSKTAAVLKQALYTQNNQLVAAARSSEHAVDEMSGILYAKTVELSGPGINGIVRIQLGNVKFNQLVQTGGVNIFAKPYQPDYREIDICATPAPAAQPDTRYLPQPQDPPQNTPPTPAPALQPLYQRSADMEEIPNASFASSTTVIHAPGDVPLTARSMPESPPTHDPAAATNYGTSAYPESPERARVFQNSEIR